MKDERKTKEQLINELVALRQRIAELETSETQRKRAEEALSRSLEEVARGQQMLLALSQAAQAVQRARTPDEVYRAIGDEIARLGYHALVLTVTDDRAHLVLSHVTFKPALVQAAEKLTGLSAQDYRFPLVPGGSYQQLIAEGKTAFTEQVAERIAEILPAPVRPLASQVAARLGLQQSIATLLKVGGETHGLLVVAGTGLTQADVPAITAFANQAAIAIENARLYQAERKQAAQLAVVSQVARRAASILDPEQLLQEAVTAIRQSFHYYHVGLFLLDEVAGELKMRAIAGGFEDVAPPDHRLALGEGMVGWTAETGQSLLANDVSQEPRYVPGILREALTQAELSVPLKLASQVIGVLDIQCTRLNAFDETDLMAMETLADQLAVAIENAHLYQETVQRLQEAETFSAITTTLTRSLDLDQVLQSIVESAARLIPAGTGGVIHLVDEATGKLIPRAAFAPEVNVREKYLEMSIGEGIAGLVVQEKRLINVPNVEQAPHFLIVDTAGAKKSLLTVPLLMDKDCLGTLSLNSDQVSAFSANDEWLLTTLAAQAAIAVRNARLFEQAQREIAERKQAEGSLRESEERLRSLFETMAEGIVLIAPDGQIVQANLAAERILGLERSEIEGRNYIGSGWEIFRPDGTPMPPVEMAGPRAMNERRPVKDVVMGVKRLDGSISWINVSAAPLMNEAGGFDGVVGTFADITERKRAEEALRESEASYRELADSITDVFFGFDQDLRYTYWNKASETLTGIPAQEALGKSMLEVFPDTPEIRRAEKVYRDVLRMQQPQTFVNDTHLDGKRYFFEISVYPSQRGISVFVKDITEHKRMDEALQQSERNFKALAENANDGILIGTGEEGWHVYANRRAVEITGYSIEELFKTRIRDLAHPDELPKLIERYKKRLAGLEVPKPYETTLVNKDGIKVLIEISPSKTIWQNQLADMVIFRDITERKRAEEEIRQRSRELAALLEASQRLAGRLDLDELLDAVAHSIVDTLPTAEAASLWLYDERRNELVARAWAGHDDKAIFGLALSPKTSLVGLVYRSRQPQMIDDVPSELAFELLGRPTLDAVRSVLGVPLLVEGRPIGALFADNFSRPQAFSRNDVRLLQSLASQATIAIENVRLLDAVTKHRGDLQSLSARLINAQEAERKRISQGLHDEMGQALTAMSINLAAVEKELPPELAPTIRERLAETSSLADQTLEQIRELSLDLRPSLLDDLGLVPTLRWYVNRYAKRMDIEVRFEAIDLEERLTAEMETALYRTVQEALTNAARHAQASRVRIRLERQESKISAFIEDDGQGFDVQEAADREPSKRGAGLLGIRERVTSLGGRFRILSRPGRGTRLTVEIPL